MRPLTPPVQVSGPNDGWLSRSPRKGTDGDALFAVLCGCGHKIRKILACLRVAWAWLIVATAVFMTGYQDPEQTSEAA